MLLAASQTLDIALTYEPFILLPDAFSSFIFRYAQSFGEIRNFPVVQSSQDVMRFTQVCGYGVERIGGEEKKSLCTTMSCAAPQVLAQAGQGPCVAYTCEPCQNA